MKRLFSDRTTGLFFLGIILIYLYWSPSEKPFEHLMKALTEGWAVVLLFGGTLSLLGTGVYRLFFPYKRQGIKRCIDGSISLSSIAETLREKGFKVRLVGDNGLTAEKGHIASLAGFIVRLSLSGLLVCLFFSSHLRQVSEVYLYENAEVNVFNRVYKVKKVDVPLPEDILIVGEKKGFRVRTMDIMIEDEDGLRRISNGFPRSVRGVYFIPTEVCYKHRIDVGYNGREFSKDIYLEVLPPGKSYPVRTDFEDILFGFRLHPEREIKKGILTGRVYNLHSPQYELTVQWTQKTEHPAIKRVFRPDNPLLVDSLSVRLDPGKVSVKALAVKDPVVPVAYFFGVLFVVGIIALPFRLFWFRQRVDVKKTTEGWAVVVQRQQYERWSEEFLEGIIKRIK